MLNCSLVIHFNTSITFLLHVVIMTFCVAMIQHEANTNRINVILKTKKAVGKYLHAATCIVDGIIS